MLGSNVNNTKTLSHLLPQGYHVDSQPSDSLRNQYPTQSKLANPEKRFSLLQPFKSGYLSAIGFKNKDLLQLTKNIIRSRNTDYPFKKEDNTKIWLISQAIQRLNKTGQLSSQAIVELIQEASRFRDEKSIKKILQYAPENFKNEALFEILSNKIDENKWIETDPLVDLIDLKKVNESGTDKKNNLLLKAALTGNTGNVNFLIERGIDCSLLLVDPDKLDQLAKISISNNNYQILNIILQSGIKVDQASIENAIYKDFRIEPKFSVYEETIAGIPYTDEQFEGYEEVRAEHRECEMVYEKAKLMLKFHNAVQELDKPGLDEKACQNVLKNLQAQLGCETFEVLRNTVIQQLDRAHENFELSLLTDEPERLDVSQLYSNDERRNIVKILGFIQHADSL